MVPKRALRWNNTLKFKAYLSNNFKQKPFKRRSSGIKISVSRLDVPLTPYMPVFPQQDRCNRIAKSIVSLSIAGEIDPSVAMDYIITPVMIFKADKGSCCLLYGDCGLDWTGESMKLTFPDKQILELHTDVIAREKSAIIHGEKSTLVALSCETSEPNEPFQAIEFGDNVEMNQLVFLFDFRYTKPSVTDGTVAYADSSHFILDATPHHNCWYGAFVFDVNDKLVGLVYSHAGSLKAIQVNHLKPMLAEILPVTQMTPRSLAQNSSLRDIPSPPQPHAGEEEAALRQDAQASTVDAAADTTLDFDKKKLDVVYAKISPFIVAVRLELHAPAVGFVIHQTSEHYKIAVHSLAMRSEAISVKFANKHVSRIDKVKEINEMITIVYVKRLDGVPLLGVFDDADPTNNVCEKVVTFFPYMDGIAMFKGHIILNDSTCRTEMPSIDFTFTCPYASDHSLHRSEEMLKTLQMTVGAPIFNLEGFFLGVLTYPGEQYNVKYAMNSSNFYNQLHKEILGKKSNSDERKHTKDEHEEKDGTKGAKGKKSKSKDETKHRKDKHKEEDGMKGAKKGKKSNSKDETKNRKHKHEEEGGQDSVGSDIAH